MEPLCWPFNVDNRTWSECKKKKHFLIQGVLFPRLLPLQMNWLLKQINLSWFTYWRKKFTSTLLSLSNVSTFLFYPIDFVIDSYNDISIKSDKRSRRWVSDIFLLKGPSTRIPKDWKGFLCNEKNQDCCHEIDPERMIKVSICS